MQNLERFKFLVEHLENSGNSVHHLPDSPFCNLSQPDLENLLNDLYDELRRRQDSQLLFLPILLHLHQSRNQARQKLAKIDQESFIELIANVCGEFENRNNSKSHAKLNQDFDTSAHKYGVKTRSAENNKLSSEHKSADLETEYWKKKYEEIRAENDAIRKEKALISQTLLTCEKQNSILVKEVASLKLKLIEANNNQQVKETNANVDNGPVLDLVESSKDTQMNSLQVKFENYEEMQEKFLALASELENDAAIPNKPILALVRGLVQECKRFSDETDKWESMGLVTAEELKILAKVEKKLDHSLQSLLSSPRIRIFNKDCGPFCEDVQTICQCIKRIVGLLDRLSSISDSDITSTLSSNIKTADASSEPLDWNALVLLQQKQIDKIIKFCRILLLRPDASVEYIAELKSKLCEAVELLITESTSTVDVTELDEETFEAQTSKISEIANTKEEIENTKHFDTDTVIKLTKVK